MKIERQKDKKQQKTYHNKKQMTEKNKFNHIVLQETSSTNSYIEKIIQEGKTLEEFTVVSAVKQYSGRGQRGNSWESEEGKNLTFSFVIYPNHIPVNRQFIISKAISVAIKDTLNDYSDGFAIKWPNDIYWNDKKIAGILIEHTISNNTIDRTIVGVGININQQMFISDAPNPVSLINIIGTETDKEEVLERVMSRFIDIYNKLKEGKTYGLDDNYINSQYRLRRKEKYRDKDGEFEAVITDIEDSGLLTLTDTYGRERKYWFKEVEYIIYKLNHE